MRVGCKSWTLNKRLDSRFQNKNMSTRLKNLLTFWRATGKTECVHMHGLFMNSPPGTLLLFPARFLHSLSLQTFSCHCFNFFLSRVSRKLCIYASLFETCFFFFFLSSLWFVLWFFYDSELTGWRSIPEFPSYLFVGRCNGSCNAGRDSRGNTHKSHGGCSTSSSLLAFLLLFILRNKKEGDDDDDDDARRVGSDRKAVETRRRRRKKEIAQHRHQSDKYKNECNFVLRNSRRMPVCVLDSRGIWEHGRLEKQRRSSWEKKKERKGAEGRVKVLPLFLIADCLFGWWVFSLPSFLMCLNLQCLAPYFCSRFIETFWRPHWATRSCLSFNRRASMTFGFPVAMADCVQKTSAASRWCTSAVYNQWRGD